MKQLITIATHFGRKHTFTYGQTLLSFDLERLPEMALSVARDGTAGSAVYTTIA